MTNKTRRDCIMLFGVGCVAALCCGALVRAVRVTSVADGAAARGGAAQFGAPGRIGFLGGDDWEPALAADEFGHLYAAFAHAKPNAVYITRLMVQRSDDGGNTWTAPLPIAPAPPKGSQFDPWFAFGADGRTVSVAFLQGYPNASIEVVTSTDLGTTWSAPQNVTTLAPPLDKTVLVSRGTTMAVAFTDYAVNTWAAISQDGGAHWTTHLIEHAGSPTQLLDAGGGIDSLGNLYFAWNGTYPQREPGSARVWVTKSADGGLTWSRTDIASSGLPFYCKACTDHEYFAAQMALRVGSDDAVYLLWNGTSNLADYAPERVYFSRSTDHGTSYSPRQDVSSAPTGVQHCFPSLITGASAGDVRIAWMDKRNGPWNVFYRTSINGGRSFTPETRLSTYVPGYNYLKPAGFEFPYGDYFQLAVDPNGRTHAAFGETLAITSPGNIWVANEQ